MTQPPRKDKRAWAHLLAFKKKKKQEADAARKEAVRHSKRETERLPDWLRDASLKAAGQMLDAKRKVKGALWNYKQAEEELRQLESEAAAHIETFHRHVGACKEWLEKNPYTDYEI